MLDLLADAAARRASATARSAAGDPALLARGVLLAAHGFALSGATR